MEYFIILLSVLITCIGLYMSVINFSKSEYRMKSFFIFILIMFPLFTLSRFFFDGFVRLIVILIFETISLYFSLFNKDIGKAFYYALVYEFFAYLAEILLSILFVLLTNYNMQDNLLLLTLIFSIFNSLIVFLISKINKLSNLIQKFKKKLFKNKNISLYMIIIFLLMFLLMMFNINNFKKDLSFFINAGMTFFVFVTLIYIIYKDFKNDKLENNYNEMMEYVQKYEKIINEQGKKNHEYNNQLTVIRGYSNNPKKLEEYLDTIIEDHKCGQNYTIRQLSNFPDGGIKGLIYHKLGKMEDNNIKYYLYIDSESKNIFENKFDLKTYQDITKLLGVFLDNAIDASKESKEKEIELDIKNEDKCIIITISNTFNNNVDTKQIGKKGFTTKGKGHGYGLSIVKDINKHNENIETFNDIEDDKFTQTILIYYK